VIFNKMSVINHNYQLLKLLNHHQLKIQLLRFGQHLLL
jgi:hypothetical protein